MATKIAKFDVTDKINEIKRYMPETYKTIQAKAALMGNVAYELVRRGLRGEPNCFYAFEAGRIVGTPYTLTDIQADLAKYLLVWGCACACILTEPKELTDGTH